MDRSVFPDLAVLRLAPVFPPDPDKLAELLGSFAGQLTETSLLGVTLEFDGEVANMNTRALTAAALAGLLRPVLDGVNMVSAPAVMKVSIKPSRMASR